MELQAILSANAPRVVINAMAGAPLARGFATRILGTVFKIDHVGDNPADHQPLPPILTTAVWGSRSGVHLRLTGVTLGDRPVSLIHQAVDELVVLGAGVISSVLHRDDTAVQLRVSLVLDEAIETSPGSGRRSTLIESPSVWINSNGPVAPGA